MISSSTAKDTSQSNLATTQTSATQTAAAGRGVGASSTPPPCNRPTQDKGGFEVSNEKPPRTTETVQKVLQTVDKIIQLIGSLVTLLGSKRTPTPAVGGSSGPSTGSAGSAGAGTTGQTAPSKLGQPLPGSGDFLWKPQSDKDGKLAILLPPGLSGEVAKVTVVSSDGSRILEGGKFSGTGNGGREHYRFSSPGGNFPDGSHVLIALKDGRTQYVTIKDTAARLER